MYVTQIYYYTCIKISTMEPEKTLTKPEESTNPPQNTTQEAATKGANKPQFELKEG